LKSPRRLRDEKKSEANWSLKGKKLESPILGISETIQMSKYTRIQNSSDRIEFWIFRVLRLFWRRFVCDFEIRISDLRARHSLLGSRKGDQQGNSPSLLSVLDGGASIKLHIGGLLE
jgi:hypothetical protein